MNLNNTSITTGEVHFTNPHSSNSTKTMQNYSTQQSQNYSTAVTAVQPQLRNNEVDQFGDIHGAIYVYSSY